MARCVSVSLENLRDCSEARVELINETIPGYTDTDENGYDYFVSEQVSHMVIVRLWPNIQLTLDVNLEDSVAWSCDRNGHVYNLLRDYGITCHEF